MDAARHSSLCWFVVLAGFTVMRNANALQRRYVIELCPGSVGPSHGEVVKMSPDDLLPGVDIDCWLTLRGMPLSDPAIPRYVTLEWRNAFSIRGYGYGSGAATADCDTAFMEIYQASLDGRPIGAPAVGPLCGNKQPEPFSTQSQAIVLRVFVAAIPAVTTTLLPPQAGVTVVGGTADTVTGGADAGSSNDTATGTRTSSQGNIQVNFTADFTSYFLDCSLDGTDDVTQLQCDTGRCLDTSLQCDRFGANNCGDRGDQAKTPPGNCTNVPKEEPFDPATDLLPLWTILGALALLATLFWCCWRPGYLPWRLARMRNVACCQQFCKPCRRAACCHSNGICGPAKGCCKRACSGSTRTGSGHPDKTPDDTDINDVDSQFAWLSFAGGDGMHIRELR